MHKTIWAIIATLFLSSCQTNTNTGVDNIADNDSSQTLVDDSITWSLLPLSSFINEHNPAIVKIRDTLLSYPEITNLLEQDIDTAAFEINLYVLTDPIKKDSLGNFTTKNSKSDFTVCLWTISRKTGAVIKHGNFHFNTSTLNFFVTDSTDERRTIEVWCKKQQVFR